MRFFNAAAAFTIIVVNKAASTAHDRLRGNHQRRLEDALITVDMISDRIAGGSNAAPNKYPYHAQMHIVGSGFYLPHLCGGALIAPQVIATAASCIPAPENAHSVLFSVGFVCSSSSNCGAPMETGWGFHAVVHPNYDPVAWYKSNILLLILLRPIENVTPVTPDSGLSLDGNLDLHGLGLGFINDKEQRPNLLQDLALELYDSSDCADEYGLPAGASATFMCTNPRNGAKGGHCGYDMGSGIYNVGRGGTPDVLVGLHSFRDARSCADPVFADGHTSVASAFPWIQSVVCPLGNNMDKLHWCAGFQGERIVPNPPSPGDITIVIPGQTPQSQPMAQPPTEPVSQPTAEPMSRATDAPTTVAAAASSSVSGQTTKTPCPKDGKKNFKPSLSNKKTKKCKWLAKKEARVSQFCSSGLSDARFVCQRTCDTCGIFGT